MSETPCFTVFFCRLHPLNLGGANGLTGSLAEVWPVTLCVTHLRGHLGPSGLKSSKGPNLSFLGLSAAGFTLPRHCTVAHVTRNLDVASQRLLTLTFQSLLQHFCQAQTLPLLRGRRLSGSWRGSVLSRFSVGFWLVLVIFDRN